MTGDEEAEDFFFCSQPGVLVPVRHVRKLIVAVLRFFFLLEHSEQSMLARFDVALYFLRAFNGAVDHRHQLRAAAEGIHGTTLDQRFEDTLVQQPQVDLFAELKNRAITPQFPATRDD